MKTLKNTLKRLWQDESGQGATEYILIMVVLAVLIFAFKDRLGTLIEARTNDVSDKLAEAISDM